MGIKYFTPTAKEVLSSYEFEYKPWKRGGADDDRLPWTKSKDLDDLLFTCDLNLIAVIQQLITNKWIRIKFLDYKDIESAGWKFIIERNCYYYKNTHYMEIEDNTFSIYKIKDSLEDINNSHTGNIIFKGTIKDKLNLIQLMNNLNI